MANRSPILGYNHNIRHRGLVFHVQTEDSGVNNPHVFTHLFHGGVIITTRKLDYDPKTAEESVKSLMQAQHKAILRELKRGEFSAKIDSYLGNHPDLLPFEREDDGEDDVATPDPVAVATAATQPVAARSSGVVVTDATRPVVVAPPPSHPAPSRDTRVGTAPPSGTATQPVAAPPPPRPPIPRPPVVHLKPSAQPSDEPDTDPFIKHDQPAARPADVSAAFDAIVASPTPPELSDGTVQIHSPAPPSAPEPPGVQPQRPGSYAQHRPMGRVATPPPPSVPPPADERSTGRVPRSPPPVPKSARPKRSGVVVSRPAVIVGAPNKVVGEPAPSGQAPARPSRGRKAASPAPEGLFGQGLISEKSLDEVILAYLSDDGSED